MNSAARSEALVPKALELLHYEKRSNSFANAELRVLPPAAPPTAALPAAVSSSPDSELLPGNFMKSASASASKLHTSSLDMIRPNDSLSSERGWRTFGFGVGQGANSIGCQKEF